MNCYFVEETETVLWRSGVVMSSNSIQLMAHRDGVTLYDGNQKSRWARICHKGDIRSSYYMISLSFCSIRNNKIIIYIICIYDLVFIDLSEKQVKFAQFQHVQLATGQFIHSCRRLCWKHVYSEWWHITTPRDEAHLPERSNRASHEE